MPDPETEPVTNLAGVGPDLTVIIPMHNASATVPAVVGSFLDLPELAVQVIAVDDASTDDSVARLRALDRPEVVVEGFEVNHGAGIARNHGFERAAGRYTLFFDADDQVHPDALRTAVRALDETGADVAMTSYRYRRGEPMGSTSNTEEMNSFDAGVWSRYAGGRRRVARLDEVPRLLGFSNYPWNKLVRTDHFRRTGLRYGSTQVHNDVLGHWLTLLDARSLVLVDQPLCTHIVTAGGRNLTNRESRARLSLIDALDETYTALEVRPAQRNRYSHHYWDFALRVAGWATARLTPDVLDEFNQRLQQHLLRMDLADFTRIRMRRDAGLAGRIVRRALA